MKKFVLGVTVLLGAWLWSRGARDPREWPERLPKEFAALWDDIDEALAAGRRAAARDEVAFDEEFAHAQSLHMVSGVTRVAGAPARKTVRWLFDG